MAWDSPSKLSYLRVWGCEAFVKHDTLTKPDKLDPRSFKCIFVGYPKETIGYSFYSPSENKVFVAWNAEFFESKLLDLKAQWGVWKILSIQEEDKSFLAFKKKTERLCSYIFKARLVAKWLHSNYGVGYEKPFLLLQKLELKVLIAIDRRYYDYEIWQRDVNKYAIHSMDIFTEEVYMEQTELGFCEFPKYPNKPIAIQNRVKKHWTAVKNILKYLRNTKDMFLVYGVADWRYCGRSNLEVLLGLEKYKTKYFAKPHLQMLNYRAFDASKGLYGFVSFISWAWHCSPQLKTLISGNNAEASSSATRQEQQTEPAIGQDASGGSSVGAVIGWSIANYAGGAGGACGAGVGVGSQVSDNDKFLVDKKDMYFKKKSPMAEDIMRIKYSGYGVYIFNSAWFPVKCRHKYALSSLLDTTYRLSEQIKSFIRLFGITAALIKVSAAQEESEYDLWKMRMEKYLQCIDYTLWEIIENGNAPIVTKTVNGKETVIPPTSVEEKNRFGGNTATKKTQKNLLKQQYENFAASSIEVIEQTYERLQKLISQLEMHGEVIPQEDINQKFLRSLSQE
ncbi:ribonuclease H-like domain-containing protein [Tanacetum coccineum]